MNLKMLMTILAMLMLLQACEHHEASAPQAEKESAVAHALKHADPNYVCPMHPQIVRNEPGSCPICGMDLVKVDSNASANDGDELPAIQVKANVQHNLALRTEKVSRTTLWRYIETVGRLEYNEEQLRHVHVRAEGWVEKLYVNTVGAKVVKDQVLLEVYSPEILAAQEEMLVAQQTASGLMSIAMDKLRLLGVADEVVREIRKSGKTRRTVPVLSPSAGVITQIGLREGMYIKPELELYTIAAVDDIWVQVDVFPQQLDWVKTGRPAEIQIQGLPGRKWEGEVEYIYPELDPRTRSLKVRLRFPNAKGELKPNMFADVVIYGGPNRDVLAIPREALIMTEVSSRVIKKISDDHFQPVSVETGMSTHDRVEILDGLGEGDEVVVSGQFMIDSESNLQASFRRMGDSGTEKANNPAHAH
jgi:Cu(I)/Ag(I) efflux system membrane fusion protein